MNLRLSGARALPPRCRPEPAGLLPNLAHVLDARLMSRSASTLRRNTLLAMLAIVAARVSAVAFSARSTERPVLLAKETDVRSDERVPTFAVDLYGVQRRWRIAPPIVFQRRRGNQVPGIEARSVPAAVVEVQGLGDWPNEQRVRKSMHELASAVSGLSVGRTQPDTHVSVAARFPVANPTGVRIADVWRKTVSNASRSRHRAANITLSVL